MKLSSTTCALIVTATMLFGGCSDADPKQSADYRDVQAERDDLRDDLDDAEHDLTSANEQLRAAEKAGTLAGKAAERTNNELGEVTAERDAVRQRLDEVTAERDAVREDLDDTLATIATLETVSSPNAELAIVNEAVASADQAAPQNSDLALGQGEYDELVEIEPMASIVDRVDLEAIGHSVCSTARFTHTRESLAYDLIDFWLDAGVGDEPETRHIFISTVSLRDVEDVCRRTRAHRVRAGVTTVGDGSHRVTLVCVEGWQTFSPVLCATAAPTPCSGSPVVGRTSTSSARSAQ